MHTYEYQALLPYPIQISLPYQLPSSDSVSPDKSFISYVDKYTAVTLRNEGEIPVFYDTHLYVYIRILFYFLDTFKLESPIYQDSCCYIFIYTVDIEGLVGCTALHCTALHCTALHCTALHCTVLHCTALQCTALYCTVLYCTALCCFALHCTALYCTAVHRVALHCTVLHSTAQYCVYSSIIYSVNYNPSQLL